MNAQKAKELRRIVRNFTEQGVLSDPYARYGFVEREKKVLVDVRQEDGTTVKELQKVIRRSVVLDPKCPKAVYRRMKKHGLGAVLHGRA